LENLTIDRLDSLVLKEAKQFLSTVNKIYVNRNSRALREKQRIIKQMTSSPKKVAVFIKLKSEYTNDQVTSLVFDNKEKTRILEYEGRLIQQIYPIFSDPDPENFLDFRTLFYVPKKYFAGRLYETLLFNCAVMWGMTIFLIITLYFDVLRKLVTLEGRVKTKSK
jgi:hypothetical protein